MQFRRVSACCAALLAVVALRFVHTSSHGQPAQQHSQRRTLQGIRVSGGSAAAQDVQRSGTATLSAAPQQAERASASQQLAMAHQAPGQHVLQISVLPQHAATSPILLAGRQQSLLTAPDPAQAVAGSDQRTSGSGSSRGSSSPVARTQAADAQPDGRQQAADSAGARARRALLASAEASGWSLHQQGGGVPMRRVIDSGPALDAGVRLSIAELLAGGAVSLASDEPPEAAITVPIVGVGAGSDRAMATQRTFAAVDARTAALNNDPDGSEEVPAREGTQEPQSQASAVDNRYGAVSGTGLLPSSFADRPLGVHATAAVPDAADREPSSSPHGGGWTSASTEESPRTKASGSSLGAARVEPGEDAWWRRVHQDPAQCGIADAALAAVLAEVRDCSPDDCARQCRCCARDRRSCCLPLQTVAKTAPTRRPCVHDQGSEQGRAISCSQSGDPQRRYVLDVRE